MDVGSSQVSDFMDDACLHLTKQWVETGGGVTEDLGANQTSEPVNLGQVRGRGATGFDRVRLFRVQGLGH